MIASRVRDPPTAVNSGPNRPALALDHVAQRAVAVAVKQFFAMRRVAERLGRRLHLYAADVGDDLPDFFVGHAHALAVGSVGGHGGAGNAIADDLKHLRVGVRVLFLRAGQVGAAASAMRAEAVAERAVDAEFVLARLRRFGIVGQGIAIFGGDRGCRVNDQGQARVRIEELPRMVEFVIARQDWKWKASTHRFSEFAAFYVKR